MKLPTNTPVKIVMLGAGGTGGHIAPHIYRLLYALDRPSRFIICDGDKVEFKNLVRQNFSPADLGENKAKILAERYAAVFGMEAEYLPAFVEDLDTLTTLIHADGWAGEYSRYPTVREQAILIGAVDNDKSRQLCHKAFLKAENLIYIDSGNGEFSGQVVCGVRRNGRTVRKPVGGVFPELLKVQDRFPSELSCAEASLADPQSMAANITAAMVVRTIFQLKMEGYSQQAIANYLSSEGVLPPAAYKQQQGLKYQSGFQTVGDNNAWSPVAVRAILENPIYIGTLVQGKRGTPNYKIKQMKLRSKEDWCVVEKNHAPIISEELFTSVQHLLSLDTRTSPSEEVVQPLAGMLYCADCGRAMCRRSVKRGNRTFYYYVCSTHKRSKLCSSHSISQTALEEVVLRAIQKQIEMVVDIDQLIHEIGQKSIQAAKHRQLDMTIEEKEKQITEQKEYRMRLLEAFHDDLISRTEYDMMRQCYTQRIDALQAALASLHQRRQSLEEGAADTRNWVAEYTKFRKIDKLTREMVAGLIRRITVSEGKQITIQFNYADELASYQQMIAVAAKEVG